MNDRTPDLTPPPDRPLPDQARARLRDSIMEAAGERSGSGRRWLLPIAAAAAVLVISGATGYVALRPAADSTPGVPAGSATPTLEPTPSPSAEIYPPTPGQSTPPPAPTAPSSPEDGGCGDAVTEQLREPIEQVATWQLPDGIAGIWVDRRQAVLCEDSGGIATAHHASPTDDAPFTEERLFWSTSTYGADGPTYDTAFVAGGRLPEGVTGIDYLWPDGHNEPARIVDEGERQWWLVAYVPEEGVLVDRGTNFTKLADVRVTVSYSGTQDTFELPFMASMCNQANHGC